MAKNTQPKNTDTVWSPLVKIVAIVCAVVLLATIALAVVAKTGYFRRNTVVMSVGDTEINALEYNYAYYGTLNDFYSQYYYYASMIGFDLSTSLKSQKCYFDSSKSWYEYFVEQAKTQLEEQYLIYNKAVEEGFQMTEDSAKELEESFKELEDTANTAKTGINKYIQSIYGPNITFEEYKEIMTRRMVIADYYENYMDNLKYDNDKIEKYYSENKKDLDVVKYYTYTAKADTTNNKTAKDVADGIKASSTDVDSYLSSLEAIVGKDTFKAETYLKEGVSYTQDDETSEWLFNDERKAGDVTVIKKAATSSSSTDTYTVICFLERGRETYKLATMRHILFTVEDLLDDDGNTIEDEEGNAKTNDAEMKAEAEKILNEWKNGAATADSFAELAKKHSDDEGSAEEGGLYEDFDQDTMVDEITEWIWKDGRKEGDCEIVKTTYGYHIVYFVEYGDEKWNSDVVNTLKNKDYEEYLKSLKEKYPVSFNEKGLSQVG